MDAFDELLVALRALQGRTVEVDVGLRPTDERLSDGIHDGRGLFSPISAAGRLVDVRRSSRANERWYVEIGTDRYEGGADIAVTVDRLAVESVQRQDDSVSFQQQGLIVSFVVV
jgi:hypothetical protein